MSAPTGEEQADAIAASVESGIAETTVDNTTVKEHKLTDRIEAAKFAAANRRGRGTGIRMVRIIPPGSV